MGGECPRKGTCRTPSLCLFTHNFGGSELISQRTVHGGDIQEDRGKRSIESGYLAHPRRVFGVVRVRRIGLRVHNLLVSGKSSGVFRRAAPCPIDQSGQWSVFACWSAGNQFEPVKPAVTKVVFIKDCARTLAEQLIEGELLLGPVPRLFTLLPRKPPQDLRNHAVNRLQRREGLIRCEPVQVQVLPAKDCLLDLVYLIQSQGAPNLIT